MRTKRIVFTAFLALVWTALVLTLMLYAEKTKLAYNGVSVRMNDASVSARVLQKSMEGSSDLRLSAAWSREKNVFIEAGDQGAFSAARLIRVYGDIRAVCPMRLLSGSFLLEDDLDGCLVSSDIAMALFRSTDASAVRIDVDGKPYAVRGVISAYEPMVIVRDEEATFENLELVSTDASVGGAAAKAFLYRNELSNDYVLVQSGMYARMLCGVSFLPAACACMLAFTAFVKAGLRRKRRAVALIYLLPAVLCIESLIWIAKKAFYVQQTYLPTKCADFAFWRDLWGELHAAWKALSLTTPLPKDVQFYAAARIVCCGALCALLAEIGLFRRILSCGGKSA